ncbi:MULTISPECIES: CBS domain-containing protein [Roseiflexus]|jgi:tRNA nucleotidyltransferase (CCA-adding enzyme)|uniref:Polynucleotide adenylyltransferase region n=1 Tax=Roseiflexus castenholzii (strain DSM 13941 / HLO8) TaxID=383372 RepID=A7NLZ8_ROSCS|nr:MULTISPECIES: CBS domain-containing protein [Roseiflexus]ABU58546.1 Polynucleotide adenylyltransferase region [Roseiflexus castenholzii DSM 13941]GIW01511.1 MAG: poly(A) polymerase [Roseiflexus sp.]
MELILTHSNTDFDALASQLAATRLYPGALAVLNPQLNENVREFAALHREELPFVRMGDLPREPVTRLILVDTATVPRLPLLGDTPIPTIIIDHHRPERDLAPHEEVIYADTGATTTILVQRLMEHHLPLTSVEATLLLLGIYEDTGNLSLPGTRAVDVACAAWLLECGARIEAVGEFLRRPLSSVQEQVLHQLEQTMRLEEISGWTALFAWARVDGPVPELSSLAHRLRDLYAPAVIALAIATGDTGTQLILRAGADTFDAGALAARFGGGGHRYAAAAYVRGVDAETLLARTETAVREVMQPALTAADIMTRPVHTAPIDATVAQAEELLLRYGHGALPVVNHDGVVQGLISRRDLDRALRHGLRDAPLARYLWHGPTLLPPDASLATVRSALAADNGDRTGRLLVVDAHKRLLGIITRSDLLRAWAAGQDAGKIDHAIVSETLERFLDPALLAILRRAGAIAQQRGAALYIVGGAVRDMILERKPDDLDLVVEGDAIGLAEALATELGGAVRSHSAFGTATLTLKRLDGEPLTLDFVMARTEFYERPSALPDVEAASLRHDLHRRDFTINTLAICLNPTRYGWLYDFYGGRRDMNRKLIRVLHNLSFIDDPTRILRAARLAARLGFVIEPRTRALIGDALEQGVLGRATPQRIMHELRLILAEEHPEPALALLDDLGVLRAMHPALRWSPAIAEWFAAARQAAFPDAPLPDLYLALLLYPLIGDERTAFAARYRLPASEARLLADLTLVHERVEMLRSAAEGSDQWIADSAIDRALHGIGIVALRAAQIAEPPPVPQYIARYIDYLRSVKLAVDGKFLESLGLRPGPRFGELLAALRAAHLDGIAVTREEQEAWIRQAVVAQSAPDAGRR